MIQNKLIQLKRLSELIVCLFPLSWDPNTASDVIKIWQKHFIFLSLQNLIILLWPFL